MQQRLRTTHRLPISVDENESDWSHRGGRRERRQRKLTESNRSAGEEASGPCGAVCTDPRKELDGAR